MAIINQGRQNVLKLLAGNAAGKKITHISVGTSGAAVTDADTVITGAIDCPVILVEYLPGNFEVYSATLDASVPAFSIAEAGLKNEDGVLVHRKVLSPVFSKAAGLSYTLKYKIKVV